MDDERSDLRAWLIFVGALFVGGWLILAFLSKTGHKSAAHIGPEAFRLFATTWIAIIGIVLVLVLMRQPPSGRPLTWAAAMAGAVGAFGLMLVTYGSVPHEWLTYAGSVLGWRDDKLFVKNNHVLFSIGHRAYHWPITVTGRAVQDTIATLIYIVFFGLHLLLWSQWQKQRATATPRAPRVKAAPTPAGTSAFGRPVAKQS